MMLISICENDLVELCIRKITLVVENRINNEGSSISRSVIRKPDVTMRHKASMKVYPSNTLKNRYQIKCFGRVHCKCLPIY